ncbi:MAG TPA: hypothetical protein VII23_11320 [Terriglobales bacterium]|jgi:hypothetical protein
MPIPRRNPPTPSDEDPRFASKRRKAIPYEFVLDAIAALSPRTNPMFGCLAIYVEDKIVLILREKPHPSADNGVWLATTQEHHESLLREFPHMRSIEVLGKKVTGWQVLPADAPDFEEAALHACDLVIARDPRIGKVPKPRRGKEAKPGSKAKSSPRRKPGSR